MTSDDAFTVPAGDSVPIAIGGDNGSGESSSNTTAGPSQGPVLVPLSADSGVPADDANAAAGIAVKRAQQAALELEVQQLAREQDEVLAINQRIADLESQKRDIRANLRVLTTPSSSVNGNTRQTTPSGSVRGATNTSLPASADETLLDYDNADLPDLDMVRPEPEYDLLKRYLDREKQLRVRLPEVYHGKDHKEWKTFITGWESVFRTQPWTYNQHSSRVNVAATGLRGTPHELWEAAMRETPPACALNWDAFKQFLADVIQAPETRKQEAFEDLKNLRQASNESVSELYTRMISAEADRGPIPERDRVSTLDAALTNQKLKELMVSILSGRQASSVAQWIETAQRAEHLVRGNRSRYSQAPAGSQGNGGSNPHSNSNTNSSLHDASKERRKKKEKFRRDQNRSGSGQASSSGPSTAPSSAKDATCYTCNQKGHYSGTTRCPKYADWARDNPEKAKAKAELSRAQRQAYIIMQQPDNGQTTSAKTSGKEKAKS
jgi:hypothetical protein